MCNRERRNLRGHVLFPSKSYAIMASQKRSIFYASNDTIVFIANLKINIKIVPRVFTFTVCNLIVA